MDAAPLLVVVGVVALAAAGAAGIVVLRAQRRRLRQQLDGATAELQRLQMSFARFAPTAVVDGIAARGRSTDAQRKEVTVLFGDIVGFTSLSERLEGDIVGFTSLSERLDPEVLVAVLNEYFLRMS